MHLKRIAVDDELYELIKYSIQSCLGDEQDYHKKEVIRLTNQIDECKETLMKMYLDQINNILDYELWVNLKNEYEVKLNRLSVELQKHNTANTNFLDTGLKILDVCRKASLPSSEISPEAVSQLVRETYLNATVKNKKVELLYREPFATIEKLIKFAKKELSRHDMPEFKVHIISQKDECIESIKKEPKGSDFNSSNCLYWWTLTYELTLQIMKGVY